MLKTFMTIGGFILCAAGVHAQERLQVQGTSPDLYLVHTVQKGENFYSLGRAYSLSPKEIAAENGITLDKGLQLGQQVKIPLKASNFSQKADVGEGYSPVYHQVSDKETLYRVSVSHNKVPLDNIRHWNNFSGDGLKKGSYIIVGWLKGGNGASAAVAASPVATPPPATTAASPAPAPPVSADTPAKQDQPAASPVPAPPVAVAPPVSTPAPVKKDADSNRSGNTGSIGGTASTGSIASAPVTPMPAGTSFEQIYMQQTNNGKNVTTEKGPGSWFKSNAGAGKYYALHNSAPRGTIIKVTNPLNGRFIYAKVLEAIPQIKQNGGLIIKLSDSAIDALGTNEAKFYCELSYED